MKYLVVIFSLSFTTTFAQNFAADIKAARASYASNKLEDAHFALLQAMQEVDLIVGKEVLKLMPAKLDNFSVNVKDDNVSSSVGFVGTTIHRSYGPQNNGDITIISNSPLVSTLSAFLNTPMLGGMMSNGDNKIVKVQGYKGQLTKSENSDGQTNYTLQLPLGNSLITLEGKNTTDTQMLQWASTFPFQQIAKLVQ